MEIVDKNSAKKIPIFEQDPDKVSSLVYPNSDYSEWYNAFNIALSPKHLRLGKTAHNELHEKLSNAQEKCIISI